MVKETFNAKETFEAGYEMGKKALPGQIYLSLIHISEPTRP